MKLLSVRQLFNFLPVIFLLSLQTVFAQSATVKTFHSFAGNGETNKIAALAAPEKPKTNFDRKTVNVLDIERRVFDLINKKRTEAGLSPLVRNESITRMARLHSENMAAYDYFSHTGFDGKMVNDRADAAGIKHWRRIGENIAYNRGYGDPTEIAVEKWMLSPGHRDNILKSDWKESGIGVAVTEKGVFYFTQVFLLK